MKKQFVIAGAGIAGLTTAIALQKKGIEAIVLESAASIAPVGAGLGLAANAIKGFKMLEIDQPIIEMGQFLTGLTIYDHLKRKITHTDSARVSEKYGLDNFTIHRAKLHEFLLRQLNPDNIRVNKRVESIERYGQSVMLRFKDGSFQQADYLIAADGVNSRIRQALLPGAKPRYAGYTCWRAVIPNPLDVVHCAEEYWGPAGRFGIVPLKDGQLYWFACVNTTAGNHEMKQMDAVGLLNIFKGYAPNIIKTLEASVGYPLIWNDIIDVKPIQQFAFGNIVLIGDAAHATTPNMGQGACQAIEDAVVLAQEISRMEDAATAFRVFEKRRMARTRDIVNTSNLLGKIAQWENNFMISLRNGLFRMLPEAVNERQLKKLYTVDLQ